MPQHKFQQAADIYKLCRPRTRFLGVCLASALSLASTDVYAQATAAAPSTAAPQLVLPAEEAHQDIAPKAMPHAESNSEPQDANTENSGSLAGNFLSSYVAHSQGDMNTAIKFLRESQSKDPDNMSISGQLLVLEIMQGDVESAIKLAKSLEQKPNHELIVDLLLAVDATREGDLVRATKFLKQAESDSFDHIWLPLMLGWLEPDRKAFVPIKPENLVESGSAVPSFITYHSALLNDYRGYVDIAKSQYLQAIADVSRAPFRALLAYTQTRAAANDREAIQQLLMDLDAKRPDMAELLRRELPYLSNLADQKDLPKVPLVNSPSQGLAEVLLTMASMLYTLDTSQDIPLYLQLALYLKPDFPTAQLMLGNYYESLELWPEALAQYKKVRASSPLYLKAGIRRAYILEKQNKPEQAEETLASFLKQFPDSTELMMAEGDMYRNRSDFARAIPYYDKVIAALGNAPSADSWVIFFARGACYERMKNIPKAEADLQQALKLSPDQPEVLNYLGYMWLEDEKHVSQALEMIKKAYNNSPGQPHIIDSMGWAFVKVGKLEEGIALLEKAAETLPNDTTINEHLGDAYWYADRQLEAKFQWQRALQYNEDANNKPALNHKIKNGIGVYEHMSLPVVP